MNIGFIGAGNMGSAIIKGVIKQNNINKSKIYVTDKAESVAKDLSLEFNINYLSSNIEIADKCKMIFLAVKPNIYEKVLNELKSKITNEHIIVSIAAGISIEYIQNFFDIPIKIVRTMPNTPALVLEGMTAISYNKNIEEQELVEVVKIFESVGKVEIIDEKFMDIIPAVSGSSPAYVYMFIEAIADGAVKQGMPRQQAYKFAAQAVYGSAKMVLETDKHPGELKDMVCSPGGTTIDAVYTLEKNCFRGSVIEAMDACTQKSRKLVENK